MPNNVTALPFKAEAGIEDESTVTRLGMVFLDRNTFG